MRLHSTVTRSRPFENRVASRPTRPVRRLSPDTSSKVPESLHRRNASQESFHAPMAELIPRILGTPVPSVPLSSVRSSDYSPLFSRRNRILPTHGCSKTNGALAGQSFHNGSRSAARLSRPNPLARVVLRLRLLGSTTAKLRESFTGGMGLSQTIHQPSQRIPPAVFDNVPCVATYFLTLISHADAATSVQKQCDRTSVQERTSDTQTAVPRPGWTTPLDSIESRLKSRPNPVPPVPDVQKPSRRHSQYLRIPDLDLSASNSRLRSRRRASRDDNSPPFPWRQICEPISVTTIAAPPQEHLVTFLTRLPISQPRIVLAESRSGLSSPGLRCSAGILEIYLQRYRTRVCALTGCGLAD